MTKTIYNFPSESEISSMLVKLEKYKVQQVMSSLQDRIKTHDSIPYSDIRTRYCAVNLFINKHGLLAPAFRPFRRLKSHRELTQDQELLSLDRQVIDLHYIYHNHRIKIKPSDNEFKPLFSSENFDFNLASKFATCNWTTKIKVKSLRLKESIQQELAVFRTRTHSDRQRNVLRVADNIEIRLHELSDKPKSRLKVVDIPNRVEEFVCLKLGKGSPKEALRFFQLRAYILFDDKQNRNLCERLRKRKEWFENQLAITEW